MQKLACQSVLIQSDKGITASSKKRRNSGRFNALSVIEFLMMHDYHKGHNLKYHEDMVFNRQQIR